MSRRHHLVSIEPNEEGAMSDTGVDVARRWFSEVWNQRRGETIGELMDPKCVAHTSLGPVVGPEEWKKAFWTPFVTGFSDIVVTVENAIASGEDVAVRWNVSMKHSGELLGVAASGRQVRFDGMSWIRVRNGRIVEGWDGWDSTGLFVRLGATPETLRQLTSPPAS
jgi:predicted ester cyclase